MHAWKQRVDCVNKLCGSYCIPTILDAHAFPHSLSQHKVSMPEQRVCKTGNEWGRKLCWIQHMQPIQAHTKPFMNIASFNTPDGPMQCQKIVLSQTFLKRETTDYQSTFTDTPVCSWSKLKILTLYANAHSKTCVFLCFFFAHARTQRWNKYTRKHIQVPLCWHQTTTHLGTYVSTMPIHKSDDNWVALCQ